MKNRVTIQLLSALGLLAAGTATAGEIPSVQSRADTFHVATLNAWGLPSPIARHRRSRLPAIAEYVQRSGFDLVGLQEVWNGARRHLTLEGLLFPRRDWGDSGLALVTRHPATTPTMTPFSRATGPDRLKTKGVLTSRVELSEDRALWTVVTHLQAGSGNRAAEVRQSQVDLLLRVLDGLDGPAVVVGDFNFYERPEDRDSEARLVAAGLVDAAERLGETTPTYPGTEHRFDRVFIRSTGSVKLESIAAQVVRYGGPLPALSDHRPVHVELAWHDLGQ